MLLQISELIIQNLLSVGLCNNSKRIVYIHIYQTSFYPLDIIVKILSEVRMCWQWSWHQCSLPEQAQLQPFR